MATTTTFFGWDIPQSTDLVKDGATAIATLGQDIDTSMSELKGGTTGQVLSKTSNTDMDFTWVTQDDTNAIQNAIIDAKGDLIVGASADTPARLPIGSNTYVLTADSAETYGVKWAPPAASPSGLTYITSGSFSATTSVTIDGCFNSTYTNYLVIVENLTGSAGDDFQMQLRYSGTTQSAGYYGGSQGYSFNAATAQIATNNASSFYFSDVIGSSNSSSMHMFISGVGTSSEKASWRHQMYAWESGTGFSGGGGCNIAQTYTGLIVKGSGNNISGRYKVYGLANS